MAESLARCRADETVEPTRAAARGLDGLAGCAAPLAGRRALIFIVSDFHFDLEHLPGVLEDFGDAVIVPLVPWDPFEIEPPEGRGWWALRDAETGQRRHVWLRASTRRRWREHALTRRATIDAAFAARGVTPLHMQGRFDAEALSRHFLEGAA